MFNARVVRDVGKPGCAASVKMQRLMVICFNVPSVRRLSMILCQSQPRHKLDVSCGASFTLSKDTQRRNVSVSWIRSQTNRLKWGAMVYAKALPLKPYLNAVSRQMLQDAEVVRAASICLQIVRASPAIFMSLSSSGDLQPKRATKILAHIPTGRLLQQDIASDNCV